MLKMKTHLQGELYTMTIYKSLEEWQKKTGLTLNNFHEVKASDMRGGRRKATQPIVTLSKNGLSFNACLTVDDQFSQTFIQPFLALGDGQLMLMFSDNDGVGKYKSQQSYKSKSRHATVGKLIQQLNNDSDYINTDRFRYRFIPTLVDKDNHRLIISLKHPYSKALVRK